MSHEKRITVLVGNVLVVDAKTGVLRNVFPGPQYYRLKPEIFTQMEELVVAKLEKLNALAADPALAEPDEKRVHVFIGDTVVCESTSGVLRNVFPGPKYLNLKTAVFVALEALAVELAKDLTGLAKQ